MKNIILSLIVLSTIACQKREVDCDNYRSKCVYIRTSYTDCTPNGTEVGWDYDQVRTDTSTTWVWGCPEKLNADFVSAQERVMNDSQTPVNLKKFMEIFPSTCNCQ